MAFNDRFRLSAHGVFTNEHSEVLLLKATYGSRAFGLPGGALDFGETIEECLVRECHEELGLAVKVKHLTGVYYHGNHQSHVFVFRCELPADGVIRLSSEHSEYRYFPLEELARVQRERVEDCLNFSGVVSSRKF